MKQNLGKAAIGVLKQLPGAATMIEREKQQMLDEIEHHVLDPNLDLGQRYATLPEEGVSADVCWPCQHSDSSIMSNWQH